MPASFFSFQQGSERAQNTRYLSESSPLLGRYRAVPRPVPTPPTRSDTAGAGFLGGGRNGQQGRGGAGRAASIGSGSAPGTPGRIGSRGVRQYGKDALSDAPPGWRGSVHVGYGAMMVAAAEQQADEDGDDEGGDDESRNEDEGLIHGDEGGCVGCFGGCCCVGTKRRKGRIRRFFRRWRNVWVEPKSGAVRRVVDVWWSRWATLVVLPAVLAIAWCAMPFPQYPLPDDDDSDAARPIDPGTGRRKVPGHGATRVQVNFWFFLFIYYSFYNLTALIWITKVFNIYSLNWWPQSLGFPLTVSAIAVLSIAVPIPIYLIPETRWLTAHNTTWVAWTFTVMAMPVAIAFFILLSHERHLKLRQSLSETQRIFTSSWWTGDLDTASRRDARRHRAALSQHAFDPSLPGDSTLGFAADGAGGTRSHPRRRLGLRRRWLPASFVRFIWFCLALFIGMLAYVIGEAYAEIYLSTLPHDNWATIIYVYGWISTVYLLDGLTGWILGGNEGERVGSYPLSFIFKLYFMLTYQTYVRALYARLRSPAQFVLLQILSSTTLIIITPLLMSSVWHWFLAAIGINGQSYPAYQKVCVRNVFIRFVAENASMMAFLGSVVVLHFGANKDVYPYFAFDDPDGDGPDEKYDFGLTFYASSITWACELVASFVVTGLVRWIYGVNVVVEGKMDFVVWPELLPTCVAVMLHVLQNMFFSIVRLRFPGP